ncbi:MAG: hypothetical protein KatS3mg132_829 [Limisphaera sp.]|nr:MAG: hypothetical protein KatS3mg132_829 [Limisphaera sp.]
MKQTSPSPDKAWLQRIRVRLIEEHEPARFDELPEKSTTCTVPGWAAASLRYCGRARGPVAGPARASPGRPRTSKPGIAKIGWTPPQRVRRLHRVANNSRFLVLVDRRGHPNLASRVLALCLKRLSRHGQPSCSAR